MAMRSISNASIGFGLVNIPVGMYSATESHDAQFHQYHLHGDEKPGRVKYLRSCEDCGAVLEFGDIAKGIEHGEEVIVVTEDERAQIEVESGKDFTVERFVHADEIDPLRYEKPYYLAPTSKATKSNLEAYAVLRLVLHESQQIGLVTYTHRGKTHLAALRTVGDVMVLQNLLWDDELRAPEFAVLNKKVEIKPALVKMATQLVESLAGEFDAAEYVDEYTEKLNELIEAKAAGQVVEREEPEAVEEVADLLKALEASLARHPAGKGRGKAVEAKRKSA